MTVGELTDPVHPERGEPIAHLRAQLTRAQVAQRQSEARITELERRLQSRGGQARFRALPGWLQPWDDRLRAVLGYIDIRWRLGRGRSLFATDWYLKHNADVASSGADPLWHYLRSGFREGRDPHPLFHTEWYQGRNPDVRSARRNPYVHYLRHGGFEERNPNPLFDSAWYLDRNPDVRAARLNPLVHFIQTGSSERRDPSPRFSAATYLEAHPDVVASGQCPLAHHLEVTYPPRERHPRTGALLSEGARRRTSARRQRPHPWVVVIDGTYPRPDRDAGSLYALSLMRAFGQLGYAVSCIATSEFDLASPYRDALDALKVEAIDSRHWRSPEEFLRDEGGGVTLFMLSRVHAGGHYYEAVCAAAPQAKIVFNTVDLHGVREHREATLRHDRRALFQARRTWERELYLARLADATMVVSATEVDLIVGEAPGTHVVHVPLIQDIPGRALPFHARAGIGFIGSYLHPPNVDAVEYFLAEIWPIVHAERPQWTFRVVGSDLPESLAGRRDPGLVIVGHVPDLTHELARLRLTVAPLRFGAGAKGKVISSLGHGVPCVLTPVADEGMGLCDVAMVGETPAEFAAQMIRLYEDERLWTERSDRGVERLRREHSYESGVMRLEQLLTGIGLPVRRVPPAPRPDAAVVADS